MVKNNSLYVALALSAAAAMIYQVVAMNYLFFYFSQNTYSIATVISIFMIGLGIGAYLIHYFKQAHKNIFIAVQGFTALYAVLILSNLDNIIPLLGNIHIILTSSVLLLPPTIALGTIFPLTARIIKTDEEVGFLYATDLLGAVIGTLLAGFLLIPEFGNAITAIVAAIINVSTIFLILKKELLGASIIMPVIILLIFMNTTLALEQERIYNHTSIIGDVTFFHGEGMRFEKNSPFGTIRIRDNSLLIDTRMQCTLEMDNQEQEMAYLAIREFNDRNLSVANIGLGCGETAAKVLSESTGSLDIIEINPVVLEANYLLSDIQEHERVNIILDDGIQYFRQTNNIYDVILIDIENPAVIHASNIYTKEAFEIIINQLSETGILGLWSYPCQSQEYNDILANTLKESFTYVYKPREIIFLASNKPLPYEEYESSSQEVNTLNNKILSKIYFRECAQWFGQDFDRTLLIGENI